MDRSPTRKGRVGARTPRERALAGMLILLLLGAALAGCDAERPPPRPVVAPKESKVVQGAADRVADRPHGVVFPKVSRHLPRATIAFEDDSQLIAISLPSMRVRRILDIGELGALRGTKLPSFLSPSLRAGTDWVLIVGSGIAPDYLGSRTAFAQWSLSSGEVKELFSFEAAAGWPSESPDGRAVAFISGRTRVEGASCTLHTAEMGKSGPKRVNDLGLEAIRGYVQWLPDSKSFLFTAPDEGVCRYDVESKAVTHYPLRGMVTLLPGGDSIAVVENGKRLRVVSFPEIQVRKEIRLKYPGGRDTQVIAIDEETVVYVAEEVHPLSESVVAVGVGEAPYQVEILNVTGSIVGLAAVAEPGAGGD